jgi:hypothetical protein
MKNEKIKIKNKGINRHVGLDGKNIKTMNSNFSFFVIYFSIT